MVNKPERTGCLGFFLKLLGIGPGRGKSDLPYRRCDNFLSAAELAFYRVLEQAVGNTYAINNKVRVADLLTVASKEEWQKYFNKISSKHIDFLLCDPTTMQPVLAIELDDSSHNRKDRRERDQFVDEAFEAAALPILHVKCSNTYSIDEVRHQIASVLRGTPNTLSASPPLPAESNAPTCPKCHIAMVIRTSGKGKHAGKRFWACTNFPQCREIIAID